MSPRLSPAPPLPVEVPAPGVRTDPFAIGILHAPPATPAYHRACDRLAIALAAREQGYFLLDTIEITSDPPDLSRALAVIEALAIVTDADTFILRGTPPPGWLDNPRHPTTHDHPHGSSVSGRCPDHAGGPRWPDDGWRETGPAVVGGFRGARSGPGFLAGSPVAGTTKHSP